MKESERTRLIKSYEEMLEEELINLALVPKDDYQEGVYDVILEICKKRGLENKINQKYNEIQAKKKMTEPSDLINFFQIVEMQAKIKELSNEELFKSRNLAFQKSEEKLIELLDHEIKERNLENKIEQPSFVQKEKYQTDSEIGFGWGITWITFGFIAGAIGIFTGLFYIISSSIGLIKMLSGLLVLFGFYCSICSYGLLKRKKWALISTLMFIILIIIFDLLKIIMVIMGDKNILSFLKVTISAITGYCWYIYFFKRKHWFK